MKILTDGRTDGRKVITITHPEHSSGELKKKEKKKHFWFDVSIAHIELQSNSQPISKEIHDFQTSALIHNINKKVPNTSIYYHTYFGSEKITYK